MGKIGELTGAQWAEVHRLRREWLDVGTSCSPADRPAAEAAITEIYRLIGKPAPQFVWTGSPATAYLALQLLSGEVTASLCLGKGEVGFRSSPRRPLRSSLWDSLGNWLVASLGRSLSDPLWCSLEDSLGDSLNGSLGDWLGDSLGDSLKGSLEDSLEDGLVESLEDSLWVSLGNSLRDSLERSLEDSLRDSLWNSLGRLLEDWLKGLLGDSLGRRFGGQHDAYWIASYDVPRRLGIAVYRAQDRTRLELWGTLARSCGWWWPYERVCVISERPSVVRTESWDTARGTVRLHWADGPAMMFRDGWPVHAWHGRGVPAWVIERPTVEAIAAELNTEVRRCAIEVMGWDRFTQEAGLVPVGNQPGASRPGKVTAAAGVPDPGNPGQYLTLYEVPERLWGSRVRLLLCTNGSAERDGTRRRYGLTVPAHIQDPLEAAAWTYGLTREQYALTQRRT